MPVSPVLLSYIHYPSFPINHLKSETTFIFQLYVH